MRQRLTSNPDIALTNAPANATAARVVSGGTHYEPEINLAKHDHWETPPKTKRVPRDAPQLIGHRCGRLTVIGLYAKRAGRWVVRCACGAYELRTTKALRNPENSEDRCQRCWHEARARKRYERLGSRSVGDFC